MPELNENQAPPWPRVGERVRVIRELWRYPHFKVFPGAEGVVVSEDDVYAVKLDTLIEGAEEWDNEVHWYPLDGDDPGPDIERIS